MILNGLISPPPRISFCATQNSRLVQLRTRELCNDLTVAFCLLPLSRRRNWLSQPKARQLSTERHCRRHAESDKKITQRTL